MAKNTYRKKKAERKSIKLSFSLFQDRKFQIASGLFFLVLAVFLLISMISYLGSGHADQSVVDAAGGTAIKESGREVQNWFGLMGAVTGHFFVFEWFGFISLIIPPFLFNIGYRIIYGRHLFSVSKSFVFTVFYLIWTSLVMGYVVLSSDEITEGALISGGIGYELAIVLESLVGWGAILFMAFLFLVFICEMQTFPQISSILSVHRVRSQYLPSGFHTFLIFSQYDP